MTALLAIDPGTEQSAFCLLRDGVPDTANIVANLELLETIRNDTWFDEIVIEQVASYGMPVGAEVFETVFISGRFAEAADLRGIPFGRLTRHEVKMHHCHQSKGVNDSVLRQAMVDRFGPGREKAIGTKKKPGPCHGFAEDMWQALALAVAWSERVTTPA